ncbi:MAG: hypothetical protein ABI939_08035 [Anaerolineaceae bacterium]
MKYRLLWGSAIAGVALHLAGLGSGVYRSGNSGLSSPPQLLILTGMALTAAGLLGVALLWVYERNLGGAGRAGLILRSIAVPAVAFGAAGAVWLVAQSEDVGGRDFTSGVSIADASLHSDPILVQADTAANGAVNPDSDTHSHTATTAAAPGTAAKSADSANAMGEGNAHTHGTEAPISAVQLAAASTFVAQVKATTAKYEDIKVAMADGYVQITQDLPGIAAHFVKAAYLADSVMMDPAKPEFLLYTKRLDGNWRLVGTMFYGSPGADPAPNYFGALDAWHLHENLCFVASGVRITASQAECKGGLFVRKTNWQLHVWTVDDADGVFAHDYSKIAPGAFPAATKPAAQDVLVRAQ